MRDLGIETELKRKFRCALQICESIGSLRISTFPMQADRCCPVAPMTYINTIKWGHSALDTVLQTFGSGIQVYHEQ